MSESKAGDLVEDRSHHGRRERCVGVAAAEAKRKRGLTRVLWCNAYNPLDQSVCERVKLKISLMFLTSVGIPFLSFVSQSEDASRA